MNSLLILLIILFIILIIVCLEDYRQRYLFCPNDKIVWTPNKNTYRNLHIRREMNGTINVSDAKSIGSINVWDFTHNDISRVVIFCHGTNGNISQRKYVYDFCNMFNLNLILFDYYGYGESTGSATETTIYSSSRLAIDYCKQTHKNDIIIWGESLGGTVAAYLAKNYICDRLILMSTFSSLDDAINYSPVRYMNPKVVNVLKCFYNTLPTKLIVQDITCPVLIVHSTEDDLISFHNAELIYLNCNKAKEKKMITIRGSHISPLFNIDQLKSMLDFCSVKYDHLNDDKLREIVNVMSTMSKTCFRY